jgi:serine/threonine protein kinase
MNININMTVNNNDYAVSPTKSPEPFPAACHRVNDAVKLQCRVYDPKLERDFVAPQVIIPLVDVDVKSRHRRRSAVPCQPDVDNNDDMSESTHEDTSHSSDSDNCSDSDSEGDNQNPNSHNANAISHNANPRRAYMVVKMLQKAMVGKDGHHGEIHAARVLIRRPPPPRNNNNHQHNEDGNAGTVGSRSANERAPEAEWELTTQLVAVKELFLDRIKTNPHQLEAVTNEVKAMRYIQGYHEHESSRESTSCETEAAGSASTSGLHNVSVPIDGLISMNNSNGGCGDTTRQNCLWLIMPFEGVNSDLFYKMAEGPLREQEARLMFRQILLCLAELQDMQLSHRDLSAENFMMNNHTHTNTNTTGGATANNSPHVVVIDFATNMRVPFHFVDMVLEASLGCSDTDDGCNSRNDMDMKPRAATAEPPQPQASQSPQAPQTQSQQRKQRALFQNMGPVGKNKYMAPEIYYGQEHDGFAVDLWSVAVLLFRMVAGQFPFDLPLRTNKVFQYLTSNDPRSFGLACQFLNKNNQNLSPLSPNLLDLLRQMMAFHPMDRLSLRQVIAHPWVLQQYNDTVVPVQETPVHSARAE